MAEIPHLDKMDSAKFAEALEENVQKHETEGGYTATRPRFRRAPRRKFTIGWTYVTDAVKTAIQSFYSTNGGHTAVEFRHPVTNEVVTVRMETPVSFEYQGWGDNALWTLETLELKEV